MTKLGPNFMTPLPSSWLDPPLLTNSILILEEDGHHSQWPRLYYSEHGLYTTSSSNPGTTKVAQLDTVILRVLLVLEHSVQI